MNSATLGFLSLENRYVIDGTLETRAAMHVGSGLEGPDTDAAWVGDARGIFIPGSSLKGVMRSTLERIIQSLRPKSGCVLFVEGSHPSCPTSRKDLREELEKMPELDRLRQMSEGGLCDICRLFGSPLLASRLKVFDSRPQKPAQPQPRHGVGIDRDTETARDKFKYDFEALEQGPHFSLHIEIENADDRDFALLGILLTEMVSGGLWIGGKKSRGLGHCVLSKNFTVTYFDNDTKFKLADYLKRRPAKLEPMPQADFVVRLDAALARFLSQEVSHAATASE